MNNQMLASAFALGKSILTYTFTLTIIWPYPRFHNYNNKKRSLMYIYHLRNKGILLQGVFFVNVADSGIV